jgi:hypothetical protein
MTDKLARMRRIHERIEPGYLTSLTREEMLTLLDIAEAAQRYDDAPDHLTLKALRAALAKLEALP